MVVRTTKPDSPGARQLADPVRTNQLFERVHVVRPSDDLERDRVVGEVDDRGSRRACSGKQVGAFARRRRDGDERELALDGVLRSQLADSEHVHELVHLLLDLLQGVLAAVDAQCDA